jgi:NHLM bacteriocin system ABC transporter peptidase/ATP-binding protein
MSRSATPEIAPASAPAQGPTPEAEARRLATKGRVRVPTVLQMEQVECGAASLGMILAHFGRWVQLRELRVACGISRDGASALDIVRAGRKYGLEGTGHVGDVSKLDGLTVPAIVWLRRSHFAVLEGARNGTFQLNDPDGGRYALSAREFVEAYSGAAISFEKTADLQRSGHPFSIRRSLGVRLRRSRAGIAFAVATGLLAMILGLAVAPLSELFVNDVLSSYGTGDQLVPIVVALLAVGLFRGGLTLLEYGVLTRLQIKFSLVGSASFLDRLLRLPIAFYLERTTGDLSQRVTYNAQVAQLLATQFAGAAIALIGIVGYAGLMLWYQWVIGLVVLGLTLLNVIALRTVMTRRRTAQSRVVHHQNSLRGTTVSALRSIETIKASGMEDDIFASLTGQQARYINAQASLVTSTALLGAIPTFLLAVTSGAILVLGGLFVLDGSFTFGGLLALQALAVSINAPVQTLMSTGSQLQLVGANLEALDDVIANPLDERFEQAPAAGSSVPPFDGSIRLEHVSFGYSHSEKPLVTDFSLELEPGARVALVGVSGAGKTTIGNIAAGLLEPWGGSVLYGGRPAAEFPLGARQRPWAKVDQSIVLFEGTVRENVSLWDDTIPEADVVAALRDAQLLEDVLARRGGLDALVKQDGLNFSGGQGQRIEIARALALNPRAVILDEATSALDTDTETALDEALRARGLSCLIIAHRLSTIRDADEIVVLGRGGAVVERGPHGDLMGAKGEYFRLVGDAGGGGDVGT